IPFPPVELFVQLPRRIEVRRGLLGADLVGFQQSLAAQNFLRLTRHLLGLRPRGDSVEVDGRIVTAGAFPISIDVAEIDNLVNTGYVRERAAEIRRELGDPKTVLLGVDRLDYTKGIERRLKAFHELLAEGRLAVPETVMVQVATPSRERGRGAAPGVPGQPARPRRCQGRAHARRHGGPGRGEPPHARHAAAPAHPRRARLGTVLPDRTRCTGNGEMSTPPEPAAAGHP